MSKKIREQLSKDEIKMKTRRKIICIETQKIYIGLGVAGIKTGINSSNIGKCCNGKRNYAGKLKDGTKLHWKFI